MGWSARFDEKLKVELAQFHERYVTSSSAAYPSLDSLPSRIDYLMHYNGTGGKQNRALIALHGGECICNSFNKEMNEELIQQLMSAGWIVELLHASALVQDDIQDQSLTRRGKTCWYLHKDVGFKAVNDSVIMESFCNFMLQNNVPDTEKFMKLDWLFKDVLTKLRLGQMLDLETENYNQFSLERYKTIVQYKTSLYTFHLPVACALVLTDHDTPEALAACEHISTVLGLLFQIQDDYLDVFGDEEITGKKGTDIQDGKCTWFLNKAMENSEFKQTILDNIGVDDPIKIAKVKSLYEEIGVVDQYNQLQKESYATLIELFQKYDHILPTQIFLPITDKLMNRSV